MRELLGGIIGIVGCLFSLILFPFILLNVVIVRHKKRRTKWQMK